MKSSRTFALHFGAILFGFLLVPHAALAGTANCPKEPAQNVAIADGEIFIGTNCTVNTTGDVDSFIFNANNGDTYHLSLAINGAAPSNICLTLYDPSLSQISNGCTGVGFIGGLPSFTTDIKLTVTGTYTIVVTEVSNAAVNYALSLERLHPFPPNAQTIALATVIPGNIAELTDSNAFTFFAATSGKYEVSASLSGSFTANVCMTVYSSDGTITVTDDGTANPVCTSVGFIGGTSTVKIDFMPAQSGTYMAFLQASANDGIATYNLEVSCLVGSCPVTSPPCAITDALSYNATSGTLTMNFTLGTPIAVTWNAWLTYQNTVTNLFSVSQPITEPSVTVAKTTSLPKKGRIGVLSTLTTPTKGITCSNFAQFNTGAP